jgi:hypothetical protein
MESSEPVQQRTRSEEDHCDLVSAIWILASNDEYPEISYQGLRQRLDLAVEVNERRLVASHAELFRRRIPENRLDELKSRYRLGKQIPSWLHQLPEEQRASAIERLTTDDFFRSQFRAQTDAPRSPIEIIDWGLKHIDRLRTAAAAASEQKIKRLSSVWIPFLSTLIAFLALGSSMYVQYHSSKDQRALKEYELSFRPKLEAYTHFMLAISQSFDRAVDPVPILNGSLNDADAALIQLEPLLSPNARDKVRSDYQDFVAFCLNMNKTGKRSESDIAKFLQFRDEFRKVLYRALF